jgi:hypothetical protein
MSVGVFVFDDQDAENGLASAEWKHSSPEINRCAAPKSLKTLTEKPQMRDGLSSIGEMASINAL